MNTTTTPAYRLNPNRPQYAPKVESVIQSALERCAKMDLAALPKRHAPHRDFEGALRAQAPSANKPNGQRYGLITEIKPATPTLVNLSSVDVEDVRRLATEMQRGGASCLSVLTEPTVFKGSVQYMGAAKDATTLPVLAKDFIVHPFQIDEAAAYGADAFLLIVEILGDSLPAFMAHGRRLGMEPLVECFNQRDVHAAVKAGAKMIGVNNRNFTDLTEDLSRTEAAAPAVPKGKGLIFVSESSIKTADDIRRLLKCGANAFLVGNSVMAAANQTGTPADQVRKLMSVTV